MTDPNEPTDEMTAAFREQFNANIRTAGMSTDQVIRTGLRAVLAIVNREHRAHRGSDVEAWLKRQRDDVHGPSLHDHTSAMVWNALDIALDDYRLHADVGAPLSVPAEEIGPHAEVDRA